MRFEFGTRRTGFALLGVLGALCAHVAVARAQFQMPDMKQMSGIPRPVDDLPDHAITVRLIKGDLSHNITNHPVEMRVGGKTVTVKTDDAGRAEFTNVPPGETVKFSADVDGEHLESQEFPGPSQGGVRLMLVATDTSKGPATEPNAPAISGQVVIGAESRIVMEPADEDLNVFYLLDIANNARVPVNPTTPFAFDMPSGAQGTGVMQGSSPLASVSGNHVVVNGPFPPGHTFVQVACALPISGRGSVDIAQAFPASIEQLAVVVKKVGETTLSSPQLANQRDMPADGETYIAATGGMVAAGQPVSLSVTGLPHHSSVGRDISLGLAALIILIGVFASGRATPDTASQAAERKRLIARREKLMGDLVRLEHDRRKGRIDDRRYAARRQELLAALEPVYGALDSEETAAAPTRASGGAPSLGAVGAH